MKKWGITNIILLYLIPAILYGCLKLCDDSVLSKNIGLIVYSIFDKLLVGTYISVLVYLFFYLTKNFKGRAKLLNSVIGLILSNIIGFHLSLYFITVFR